MKRALYSIFDRFLGTVGWAVRNGRKGRQRGKDRIVLLAVGGVGDYLLLTPVLHCYRELFPHARIDLVGREDIREFANESPFLDSFVGIHYERFGRNPIERIRVWWRVTCMPTTFLVNTDFSTAHDWVTRSIVCWVRARRSIAYATANPRANSSRSEYDVLVQGIDPLCFEIARHTEMLRHMGALCVPPNRPEVWGYRQHVVPEVIDRSLRAGPYYVVFPGSYTAKKCWPMVKFVELVQRLSDTGLIPVILGGKRDRDLGASMSQALPANVVDFTGRTTLLDLAKIIAGARFLVSNDTSAAHIGAGVETRTFVLLGGGHWGRFFPYPGHSTVTPIVAEEFRPCHGCEWDCLYDSFLCVDEIRLDDVESQIRTFLLRGSNP